MKLIQGDTLTASVTLRNSDLTPIDLTGATVTFTIALPTPYSYNISITDATNGVCQLLVSSSITNAWEVGTYSYEFQIITSGGEVTTTPVQKLSVIKQLTPNV